MIATRISFADWVDDADESEAQIEPIATSAASGSKSFHLRSLNVIQLLSFRSGSLLKNDPIQNPSISS